MNELPPPKNDRDFFRVVQFSSALGLGSMAGFLYSLKQVHPAIRLELGIGTVVMFLGAAILAWVFCGMLAQASTSVGEGAEAARRRKRLGRGLVVFAAVSAVGTVAVFGYALKDVSSESRRDVIEGTAIACLVLGAGGWLIRKAFQFFEEHSAAELEQLREQENEDDE